MLESKLWGMVRQKNIDAMYMERVENNCATGTPDVYWFVPQVHGGWCELKCGVRRKERFDWLGKYTIQQRKWGKRYADMGGNYLFCAADQHNEVWWWHGRNAVVIDALPLEQAIGLCIGRGPEFPKQFRQRIKNSPVV